MNRFLSQRREALISQAADQRRQLAYAVSGMTYRLRFVDRAIGWFMGRKYTALLAALAMGAGLAMSRHGKASQYLGIAVIAWRALRIARNMASLLHAARRGKGQGGAPSLDQDQRLAQRAN
ncbi:MAG: hypothetical protein ACKVQA_23835 [Burkholderiales bacterium]